MNLLKYFNHNNNSYLYNGENFDLFQIADENEIDEYLKNNAKENASMQKSNSISKHLGKAVLNVSNACNLNCAYCYAEGGDYERNKHYMSKDCLDKIITYLKISGIEEIQIVSFFGGEPLLNYPLIEYGLNIISSNFIIHNFEVVTNATLLTESMLQTLMKYNVSLSISIDGPEDITDLLRGKGTHYAALQAINTAKRLNYPKLCAAATYTQKHLELGYTRQDILKYFETLELKSTIGRVITSNKDLKVKTALSLKEQRQDIIDSIHAIFNRKTYYPINPYLYSLLLSLIFKTKSCHYCDDLNTDHTIAFDYNGDRYNCFRLWNDPTFILKGAEKTSDKIKEINNKANRELCKNCWARNTCKICVISIMQGEGCFGIKNEVCADQLAYELCMNELLEVIESGKLQVLIDNFTDLFLIYS